MDILQQFLKFRALYDLGKPFGYEKVERHLNIPHDESVKLCKKWKQVGLIERTVCHSVFIYTNVLSDKF
jgi:hypothetical protein